MAARIADAAPSYCAACFSAKPEIPHVDFGAAYDGPVLLDAADAPQSIDDLIVCADCVRDAARVLAIEEAPVEDVRRQLADAQQQTAAWRRYAEGLEAAHAARPEPAKRAPGRPPRREPRPEAVAA